MSKYKLTVGTHSRGAKDKSGSLERHIYQVGDVMENLTPAELESLKGRIEAVPDDAATKATKTINRVRLGKKS